MYIADRDNQRIIKCGFDCEIITEYTRPDTELYDSQSFFCNINQALFTGKSAKGG